MRRERHEVRELLRFPQVEKPEGYSRAWEYGKLREFDESLRRRLDQELESYDGFRVAVWVPAIAFIAFMCVVALVIMIDDSPRQERVQFVLQFPVAVSIATLLIVVVLLWRHPKWKRREIKQLVESHLEQRRIVLRKCMSTWEEQTKLDRRVAAMLQESADMRRRYNEDRAAFRRQEEANRPKYEAARLQREEDERQRQAANRARERERDAKWQQELEEIRRTAEAEVEREWAARKRAEELQRLAEEAEERRRQEEFELRLKLGRDRMDGTGAPDLVREVMRMSGREFEELIARRLRRDGVEAEVSGGAGDRGADIVGDTEGGERVVVQCKRYRRDTRITSVQMQQFAGMVRTQHFADFAVYVTTSSFTKEAERIGREEGMYLLTHIELTKWLGSYQSIWQVAIHPI